MPIRSHHPVLFLHGWDLFPKEREDPIWCGWNDSKERYLARQVGPNQIVRGFLNLLLHDLNVGEKDPDQQYTLQPLVQGKDLEIGLLTSKEALSRTLWVIDYYQGVMGGKGYESGVPGYGTYLSEKIQQICEYTESSKVKILAHSMGGLVARWAIQHGGMWDKVDTLVTMGTPHAGAAVARHGQRLLQTIDAAGWRWIELNTSDMDYFRPDWVEEHLGGSHPLILVEGKSKTLADLIKCFCIVGCDSWGSLRVLREMVVSIKDLLAHTTNDCIVTYQEALLEGALTLNLYRQHTYLLGINHTLEGYEAAKACLFGDKRVEIYQKEAEIKNPCEPFWEKQAEIYFEFLTGIFYPSFEEGVELEIPIHETSKRCGNISVYPLPIFRDKPLILDHLLPVFRGPLISPQPGREGKKSPHWYIRVRCREEDLGKDDLVGEMLDPNLESWLPQKGEGVQEIEKVFGDCRVKYEIRVQKI